MAMDYTDKAKEVLEYAHSFANMVGSRQVCTEHILAGLTKISNSMAYTVLNQNGVSFEAVTEMLSSGMMSGSPDTAPTLDGRGEYSQKARQALRNSFPVASKFKSRQVGTEHILISLLQIECTAQRMIEAIANGGDNGIRAVYSDLMQALGQKGGDGGAAGRRSKSELEKMTRDITQDAKDGKLDPVIGREAEMHRVTEILSRRTKNNPILIGEPGVGKTAIVEGLAEKIVAGEVPDILLDCRILSLDLTGMVAGTKYRGEFEERIKRVIDDAINDPNVILFIDEIHTLIGAGDSEGGLDAANILKPALSRGEIHVIGATTTAEYRKYFQKDSALSRRFQSVQVGEPTQTESVQILQGLKGAYEEHHKLTISNEAIDAAVKLSARYINGRYLPDKAIDVMDEACAAVRLAAYKKPDDISQKEEKLRTLEIQKEDAVAREAFEEAEEIHRKTRELQGQIETETAQWKDSQQKKDLVVKADDIAGVISEWTNIPVKTVSEDEKKRLLRLEDTLHERVIGQDEAVKAVARAVRRGRSGLKDPSRPIGTFLFLGPTGVGKTELSKALAEALFGQENSMIRFDMSEYSEQIAVTRLIGSAPGYVGYEEGGQLTEAVNRNPYSVVLFDEIEKAHPSIFNLLLQIMDDGRLTDGQGRIVDFKNTVIIMTSNAGAMNIVEPKTLGFATKETDEQKHKDMTAKVMEEVRQYFRPEFLNRIDETIVFHQLSKDEIRKIVGLMIKQLNKRTMELGKVSLELDDAAIDWIVAKGYQPKYGARPLRREIQSAIEDPLSDLILGDKIAPGSRMLITVKDGKLHFGKKRGKNS